MRIEAQSGVVVEEGIVRGDTGAFESFAKLALSARQCAYRVSTRWPCAARTGAATRADLARRPSRHRYLWIATVPIWGTRIHRLRSLSRRSGSVC